MGVDPVVARGAVRVSLGRMTTADDVARFVATLSRVVEDLRKLASVAG